MSRAASEIEAAAEYYEEIRPELKSKFIAALNKSYDILELNPFFQIRYKNFRAVKLSGFPYNIYFTVDETTKIVTVWSCFHAKLNPDKRPE